MTSAVLANLAAQFQLYPCLSADDFIHPSKSGFSASYIHHFFHETVKWDWPESFKVFNFMCVHAHTLCIYVCEYHGIHTYLHAYQFKIDTCAN